MSKKNENIITFNKTCMKTKMSKLFLSGLLIFFWGILAKKVQPYKNK